MKRALSFIMILLVFLNTIPLVYSSSTILVDTDFERESVGNVPNGWRSSKVADTGATITEDWEKGKVAKLYDNNVTAPASMHTRFQAQDGIITLQFDFKEESVSAFSTYSLRLNNEIAVSLVTVSRTLSYYLPSLGGSTTRESIMTITAEKWYTVMIVADVTTNTFSVYVDGYEVLSDAPFINKVKYIDRFFVATGSSYVNNLYIDNVKVFVGKPDLLKQGTFHLLPVNFCRRKNMNLLIKEL